MTGRAGLRGRLVAERSQRPRLTRRGERGAGGGVVDEVEPLGQEGDIEAEVLELGPGLGRRDLLGDDGGHLASERGVEREVPDEGIGTEVLEDPLSGAPFLVSVGFATVPIVPNRPVGELPGLPFQVVRVRPMMGRTS